MNNTNNIVKKTKSVQIPYDVFKSLLWVLESLDTSNYDESFKEEFEDILEALRTKKIAIEKREAYSQLIDANKTKDEDNQIEKRIEYLKKRNSF